MYKNRPEPRNVLERAEIELKRELNVDTKELIGALKSELGFVTFKYQGKDRTILIAGASGGAKKYFEKLEATIQGQWESTFTVHEIRYLRRLLAYAFVDGRVVIASGPELLGVYFEEIAKRKEVPDALKNLAGKYSGAPLLMAGNLLEKGAASDENESESEELWYGVGLSNVGNSLHAGITVAGRMGKKTGPPWGARLMIWGVGTLRLAFYLIIVLSLSSIIFRIAQIRRMRNAAYPQ